MKIGEINQKKIKIIVSTHEKKTQSQMKLQFTKWRNVFKWC